MLISINCIITSLLCLAGEGVLLGHIFRQDLDSLLMNESAEAITCREFVCLFFFSLVHSRVLLSSLLNFDS